MTHLDEEQIRLAGGRGPGGLDGAARGHLDGCPECAPRVAGTARLGAVLRAAEPEAGPPSFDALIAPALAAERSAPAAPAPAPSARASLRLVAGLVLRQARLVPRMLWPLSAVGFAVLLAAALKAPSPGLGALFLGPGATLVVTVGALAACEPRRDPRMELMRTMRVPPVAVWLSRLALVLGADLAAAGRAGARRAAGGCGAGRVLAGARAARVRAGGVRLGLALAAGRRGAGHLLLAALHARGGAGAGGAGDAAGAAGRYDRPGVVHRAGEPAARRGTAGLGGAAGRPGGPRPSGGLSRARPRQTSFGEPPRARRDQRPGPLVPAPPGARRR